MKRTEEESENIKLTMFRVLINQATILRVLLK